ncbi:hypothetical protein V6N11_036657 [Hibiscus sabdariffa]|uniref:Uncharacterized protein n=1 Tax=Hibiscus sabdariffa TaxID=183260 RepID=A0ABR2RB27_9ROSI
MAEASTGKTNRASLRDVVATLEKNVDAFTESMNDVQYFLELRMSSLLNQVADGTSKQSDAIEVVVETLKRKMLAEIKQLKIKLYVCKVVISKDAWTKKPKSQGV